LEISYKNENELLTLYLEYNRGS